MKAIEDFLFEWIARDLREGKCIPFLGAGASAFPKEANAKPPSAPTTRRPGSDCCAPRSIAKI